MPMPRLTMAPSKMSCATRAASWSFVRLWYVISGRLPEAAGLRGLALDPDDLVHKDAGGDDVLGVELAELGNLVHRGHRLLAGHGHDRAEVARCHAEHQVAPAVAAFSLDQREVAVDRVL